MQKMEELKSSLWKEQARLAKKYGFSINDKHIVFLQKIRDQHKKIRVPTWKYVIPTDIRHLVSMPFIYMMIIPAVILDLFITMYHLIAFPLYRIPKVKRGDYIIYDRRFLDYLNIIQKIHCIYCSYVNGLFAYSLEIAARTERYWCPVKSASKVMLNHGWYNDFANYGDPDDWQKKFNDEHAFKACMKK